MYPFPPYLSNVGLMCVPQNLELSIFDKLFYLIVKRAFNEHC